MGQASNAVDPAIIADMQGKWISRFPAETTTIEIKGNEVSLTSESRSGNRAPLGLVFRVERVVRSFPDLATGETNYVLGGSCTVWDGTAWKWATTSGCELKFTVWKDGIPGSGKTIRTVGAVTTDFVRPPLKAAWKAKGLLD